MFTATSSASSPPTPSRCSSPSTTSTSSNPSSPNPPLAQRRFAATSTPRPPRLRRDHAAVDLLGRRPVLDGFDLLELRRSGGEGDHVSEGDGDAGEDLSKLVPQGRLHRLRLQYPPPNLVGPANIRWATSNVAKHEGPVAIVSRKRGSILYSIAYAMADILRTSIYQIVSAFQAVMQEHAKRSTLEKNWIADGKPLYATRENIIQKLHQFLEYRAY
ncbi:hypothetical protein AXF42_Ash001011 [Apostasia shenzhenica]|uniref:Uncharacterized protein n=1 Tax=Apostasia shenzhenica TaxID=1088818 RepID=A0A2I0ATP7_9ASPA|nr:hypothetical protein AXF42_Ash001011 [Apostasia shenzhenica]